MLAVDRFHEHVQKLFTRLLNANGLNPSAHSEEYDRAICEICAGTPIANRWNDTFSRRDPMRRQRLPTEALAEKIREIFSKANVLGRLCLEGQAPLFEASDLEKLVELARLVKTEKAKDPHRHLRYGERNVEQSMQYIERLNDKVEKSGHKPYKIGSFADKSEIDEIARFAYEQIHAYRAAGKVKEAYRRFDILNSLVNDSKNPFNLNRDELLQANGLTVGMGNFLMRATADGNVERERKKLISSAIHTYPSEPMFEFMRDYTSTYDNPTSTHVVNIMHRLWTKKDSLPTLSTGLVLYPVAGAALMYRSVLSVLSRGGKVDEASAELHRMSPLQAMRLSIDHNKAYGVPEDALIELEVLSKFYGIEKNYDAAMQIINEIDEIISKNGEKVLYRATRAEYQKSILYGLMGQAGDRDRAISQYKNNLKKFDLKIDVSRLN